MFISEETLDDLLRVVFEYLQDGDVIHPSKGDAREKRGVLLELTDPRARLSRTETKGKVFSGLGEFLWYLSGHNAVEFISYYLGVYKDFSEDGATIYGGYGPRIFDNRGINQYNNIVKILTEKPDSRQAVIQIFEAADIARPRADVPCTCVIQFFRRVDKLDMCVSMRSNDAYLGLPHDVFAFTMIQEIVARQIGVELGTYRHFVGSLHLYDANVGAVGRFISEGYQSRDIRMPSMPLGDPWLTLRSVLEAEKLVRTGKPLHLTDFNLEPYWADLVRLLEVFRASKHSSLVEMVVCLPESGPLFELVPASDMELRHEQEIYA